ncbi:MAG: isocitrate lyase/PEP mutase family protein [Rhodospirillaceae bacterium]
MNAASNDGSEKPHVKPTTKLKKLIHRDGKVLCILHTPTAAHARVMQEAGAEAAFVGTSGVVGTYTGMADVGTASMPECVQIAGWIANAVDFPIIMDGDTGHGGIMAVRRMIRECIKAGIAGVRIDDQPIEGKRRTQSAGMEVVPIEQAIARYKAAVDMKNELDPDFVIMAQCYARDAANSSLEDCIERLKLYEQEAGVDWVQLESPHSPDEIKLARAAVKGPLSFMKGQMDRFLTLEEHQALGVNIAWLPGFTHHVTWAALYDFMNEFQERGIAAWDDFQESRKDKPYPNPLRWPGNEDLDKQQELEQKYFSKEMLEKYKRSTGGSGAAT